MLRKASRAVARAYDEALAPHGMTTAQFAILRHVARGQPLALSRLAEELVMDRSSLYRAIAPIEARGWILTGATGGRTKYAVLTREGAAAMQAAEPDWHGVQKRIEAELGGVWTGLEFALGAVTRSAERVRTERVGTERTRKAR
ncbi:MarR family winged helix-turn-helix transcriptional regulator [Sphingomonas sp. MMS12-HWE2-04]|uniref:MarR family winged helix-turn-helix transcriptional regulator n=1 Tax=Sphingomonas sp. MMS12-HWE2-04 TaxID=3234199 RepID=UPI00384C1023